LSLVLLRLLSSWPLAIRDGRRDLLANAFRVRSACDS